MLVVPVGYVRGYGGDDYVGFDDFEGISGPCYGAKSQRHVSLYQIGQRW